MPGRPLVVLPVRAGVLPAGAAETVAEAGGADVVLIGSQLGTAAGALAGVAPSVRLAEVGDFAVGAWADALAPLAASASRVLLPASPDGRDLAARLAAVTGLPLVAGALSIAADRVVVPHHGGLVQSVLRPTGPFVATLQPGVRGVNPSDGDAIATGNVDLAIGAGSGDATIVEVEPPDAATMDLAESPRIVGGGAGMMVGATTDDPVDRRFTQLSAIGEAIGASMGATRVVTDAGWVPHSRQIGTTGVVVDPDLYLAFGISGAVQHTAGLGHPDHIISVNTDPHCPMMAMADLAITADANATLDALAALLEDAS
ncbi:MAG: mycofactocin-associated electron transfer flavoprotein alpha subunit [Acidimicrobiales bacterium]